ncbi:MAG: hypothetical protein ACODUE_03035 [Synechococcus sp.]
MKRQHHLVTVACAITPLLGCGLEARAAAVILSPASATASSTTPSGPYGGYGIENTINQSGLSEKFNSGMTNFDAYIARNPTHTKTAPGKEWFGSLGTYSAVVDYELDAVISIDKFALWNEESSGIGVFDLWASVDGVSYTEILTATAPPDNPPFLDYSASVFSFPVVSAKYLRLNLSSCPQPDPGSYKSCSIGEVAFSAPVVAVPAPVPVLGAAAFFGWARTIRRKMKSRVD